MGSERGRYGSACGANPTQQARVRVVIRQSTPSARQAPPMYIPSAFAQADPAELFAFMESYSFALLVSTHEGEPFGTHIPLLLERDTGPHGTLVGHMARANPHWRGLDGQPVLAVFSGPHAYVSPTWYESENVVPTWHYVADRKSVV